ncbi:MAG: CinA family protein [Alphaproteobacteria bacterium]|uniref:CinA family protein n=1 Tax=Candidatus Nitrobium versatile TaxID=2884831 RepID=A0A953M367_9BACT|nr:CinA family protein [Candidatus Nitrobium versatile]
MREETDRNAIIGSVHALFSGKGLTLSAAESCTGGLVCHYLTVLPGASIFFRGGLVTYSNETKIWLLGISPALIERHGVVSEETVRVMAEKARDLVQTDYSVATTGNLGPGTLEGKERGLVYLAVSGRGATFSKRVVLTGNRAENREEAALLALRFLLATAESG